VFQYHVLSASAPVTSVRIGVRSAPAPFDYTLKKLIFSVGSPNAAGDTTLDFRVNGVSIFAPAARPVIPAGQKSVAVSGLARAGLETDILSWDVTAAPLGGLSAPVTCTAVLDDGQAAGVEVAEADGAPDALTITKLVVGLGDLVNNGDGSVRIKTASDVSIPSSLPPTGTAGGSLSGDYPDPVVEDVGGRVPGSANGLATLDAAARVPMSQLPPAVAGALDYQGTWNASTNTPALTSGGGGARKGDMYKVATAGTTALDGITDWKVGDYVIFDGSAWQKVDQTESVSSVAGRTGAVTISSSDVAGLGTAATKDVAASGNASTTQVVKGNDTRLSDSRTPAGTAGGDLSNTYPAPTVNQIKGRSLGGLPNVSGTFGDDFTGTQIDTTLWPFKYDYSTGQTIVESGGVVSIGPKVQGPLSGYLSDIYNVTGKTVTFKINSLGHPAGTWLRIGFFQSAITNGDTRASFVGWGMGPYPYNNTATLFPGADSFNNGSDLGTGLAYAGGTIWLRVSWGSGAAATISYSTDGTNFTVAYTASSASSWVTPTTARVGWLFGDSNGNSAGYTDVLDSVTTDIAMTDPITSKNYFSLAWDNPNNQFSLIRTLGIIPYVAAGSPPTGAPSNLPTGHTLAVVETSNPLKLWIWNPATSAWNSQQF
jgi:hypothetical protein